MEISTAQRGGGTASEGCLPPPPRAVRLRWSSLLGPNFPYFLHVAIFSLIPLVVALWMVMTAAWLIVGHDVPGHFVYTLTMNGPGGGPKDNMYVEFRAGDATVRRDIGGLGPRELSILGMPETIQQVVPGKPLLTAEIPVRVLSLGSITDADPLFPWTWRWKRLILPGILLVGSAVAMFTLHRELYRALPRDFSLARHGSVAPGRLRQTYETGWLQSDGNEGWTYVRRVYAEYVFTNPMTGEECRGTQLVLGALDPAPLAQDSALTVLYDPARPDRHMAEEFSPFRVRRR